MIQVQVLIMVSQLLMIIMVEKILEIRKTNLINTLKK